MIIEINNLFNIANFLKLSPRKGDAISKSERSFRQQAHSDLEPLLVFIQHRRVLQKA